jgi:urocanate hydratase
MSAIDDFLSELRTHECMAPAAAQIDAWIKDARNDWRNKHTQNFLKAVDWKAARTDHSIGERLDQMCRPTQFKGPVVMSISNFTGWK